MAADDVVWPEEEVVDEEIVDQEPIDEAVRDEVVDEGAYYEEAVDQEGIDEAIDAEGIEVKEHLKDAVEGSIRLKRLLSRDDDEEDGAPSAKKKKVHIFGEEETAKVNEVLTKWGMMEDKVVRHVLEQLPMEELTELANSNYKPDSFHPQKSPAELLGRYVVDARERKHVDGGNVDAVRAFTFKWKKHFEDAGSKTQDVDKALRGLVHKELRYVIENFDGQIPLEDVMQDAKRYQFEDENLTIAGLPDAPGMPTFNRFNRLELIDPIADAAVFGDANLTFALKLAKHRKALGHVGRVIATTFEELETLRERYKEIDESIATLDEHFAEVYHGVDCTRIAIDPKFEGLEGTLGAVYYNFPHSGAVQGFFDGHPIVNWRHENLMRLFFRALRSFVKEGGCVKVASNAGAVGVRYSYIVNSALENEFVHVETMPFLEWILHRYGRSYGDKRDVYKRPDAKNNQSYNDQASTRDMVYCFRYAPTGNKLPPQPLRLPPTLKTLMACTDGPFKGLPIPCEGRTRLANQLHERFMKEVSGTHVG